MPILPKYPKKEISIRRDQKEWLKEHKEINYSGFIQDQTDILIKHIEKQNRALEKEVSIPTNRY